jgi:seryl-tRNA synthetase
MNTPPSESPHLRELLETGELRDCGDGRLIVSGRPLAILQGLDARLERLSAEHGASLTSIPTVIARDTLDRAGYFEAFGDAAAAVHGDGPDRFLTPALCYHIYPLLAGRRVDRGQVLGCAGRCFRNERIRAPSLARLWEFTMREVVFVGPPEWVEAERRWWIDAVETLSTALGLSARIEVATDPFFTGAGRGRALIQQIKELKLELRMDVGVGGVPEAVSSFNLHETFFGARFGVTMADDTPAWSGCVAFGLERWLLALVSQLGIDAALAATGQP